MIVDHFSHFDFYRGMNKKFDQVFAYIQQTDFETLEPGTYELDGKELFFNLFEYETKSEEERIWESHKKYVDIHLILEGQEFIGYELFDRMSMKEAYHEDDDYYLMDGPLQSMNKLEKGDFAIYYPQDVHKTGIMVNGPEKVRKAVFKVKL
ncbi:YhcH/YjgK/YiaL family protein [Neobacillus kokaensis]|uniref:YhcH/YjgK/YiaL family protein n=1 Tax=Neobacillus kokaensis TaxID=2759023 RepID=A0ABQ3MZB4_9BACI|nr:YhcH/YjgK/YiaL family protein [Neobacillus kokaensis]GHH97772.1 hypothetical protein AM1BK_13150 [Neobacillus kokaensis]